MNNKSSAGELIVLTLVVGGFAVLILALAWPMLPVSLRDWLIGEEGAAWMQAVFSLVGIGIAIYVPTQQHLREKRTREANERLETAHSLQHAHFLTERVLDYLQNLGSEADQVHRGSTCWYRPEEATELTNSIGAAEMRSLDYRTRVALLTTQRDLRQGLRVFTETGGQIRPVAANSAEANAIFNRLRSRASSLESRAAFAFEVAEKDQWEEPAVYVIRKVGINTSGTLETVEWQIFDLEADRWIGRPEIVNVMRLANHLRKSLPVRLTFDQSRLDGPRIRMCDGPAIFETNPDDKDSRTIYELPRL